MRFLTVFRNSGGHAGEASTAAGGRIASQAGIQLAFRLLNVALGAITVAFLARALSTSEFGVWTAALAYVGLFGIVTDLGVVQVGIQRMSDDPERESEWLGALAGLRIVGTLIAVLICIGGIPFFLEPSADVRLLALILSLTLLVSVPHGFMAVFNSRLRIGVAMAVLSLQSLMWLGAVVAFSVMGSDILDLAWAFVAIACAVAVIELLVTRRYASLAFQAGRKLWRPLLRVALPLGLAGLFATIYYRVDSVLLFNLAGPQEAGYYGAAFRILDPLHVLPTAIMSAVFPVVAAVRMSNPTRVRDLVQSGFDYLLIVSVPIFVGSLVVSGSLIDVVFGEGFDRSAIVLPILMLAFVAVAIGYVPGYLVPLVELQWRFAALALGGAVANVALNFLLIPPYGAVGAAVSTVATEFAVTLLALLAVVRRLGTTLQLGRAVRTVLAALVMGGVTWIVAQIGLLPALLIAPPAYVLALLVLRVVSLAELRMRLARRPIDA